MRALEERVCAGEAEQATLTAMAEAPSRRPVCGVGGRVT